MCSSIDLEMQPLICWECGLNYCTPSLWGANKSRRGESICCPNGHENFYKWGNPACDLEAENEKLKEENQQLRREVMQVRHDREQSEARATEARGEPAGMADAVVVQVDDQPEPVTRLEQDERGRLLCPHCRKPYKYQMALGGHLRTIHKDTDAAARVAAMVDELIKRTEGSR